VNLLTRTKLSSRVFRREADCASAANPNELRRMTSIKRPKISRTPLAFCAICCAALSGGVEAAEVGAPQTAAQLVTAAGCVGCHEIPGADAFAGKVGPSLAHVGARVYIAGLLPNTRANMIRWITEPQEVRPGDAMPNTQFSPRDAETVADFLQQLQ
jgi:cytochrome c1